MKWIGTTHAFAFFPLAVDSGVNGHDVFLRARSSRQQGVNRVKVQFHSPARRLVFHRVRQPIAILYSEVASRLHLRGALVASESVDDRVVLCKCILSEIVLVVRSLLIGQRNYVPVYATDVAFTTNALVLSHSDAQLLHHRVILHQKARWLRKGFS